MIVVITGMPGVLELLIIAFVVLLLFGRRLPDLMHSLGRSVVEFKKGVSDTDTRESEDDSPQ